ncbi:hypothetical protein ACFQ68_40090 [Amycolatopsis japonica]|uniref:hypothetical protein n=1 Tax=Amycolatopsis japonica TaxID=208439 RepID=UPI00366BBE62
MSAYSPLVLEASKKLGHRPILVDPVITVIVGHRREGKSVEKISEWLKWHIGEDNRAAQTEFVTWVLERSRRNGK